jgi:hypothetical protein
MPVRKKKSVFLQEKTMPLTAKGKTILQHMKSWYGDKYKAEQVFYASKNAGTIKGVEKKSGKK